MSKPEKIEERKFVKMTEAIGCEVIKLQTQGARGKVGYNDRLVFAAHGVVALFEFKRDGEEPSEIQNYRHKRLKTLGQKVYVVYRARKAFKILTALIADAKVLSARMRKVRT